MPASSASIVDIDDLENAYAMVNDGSGVLEAEAYIHRPSGKIHVRTEDYTPEDYPDDAGVSDD